MKVYFFIYLQILRHKNFFDDAEIQVKLLRHINTSAVQLRAILFTENPNKISKCFIHSRSVQLWAILFTENHNKISK